MKKKIAVLIFFIALTSLISSYLKQTLDKANIMSSPPEELSNKVSSVISEQVKEPVKFYAPYTGEEVDEKTSKNIAFMCIIENSKNARPQSGLIDADIVFETSAEGGIPRMLALFQKNSPVKIGPVRSMRPYFLELAREYNLPFGHCGYSEEARNLIQQNKLMTLNEFVFTGFYWRERDRKAPHNLYTSASKLRKIVENLDYVKCPSVHLEFERNYWNSDNLEEAKEIQLKVNRNYTADYSFKNGKYYKSMNSKEAVNKEDTIQLSVSNIVIQFTTIKLQEDNLHLDIALRGEGDGYVIGNGKIIKIRWSKDSIESKTILRDANGLEVPLNTGNTWWHIVDNSSKLTVN
jgi:hypothetical protein